MKTTVALYRATALEFVRDRMAILFTVLLPLLMAGFFGLIFTGRAPAGQGGAATIPMAQLYVPGMMALGFLWLGVFGTAPALVQLREQQILRRIGVTPVRREVLVIAQVAWRLTTGLIQAVLLAGFGMAAYGLRITGSWPLTLLAVVLSSAVLVAIGVLLAGLARTNESAVALGQAVQFPMMFLSGVLFPLEMLPAAIRPVAYAMPLTYVGDVLRQTMLGATPIVPLWLDFTVLAGCLIVFAALAIRLFRWE